MSNYCQWLEKAIDYIDLGWSVIPITSKSKIPLIDWKPFQNRLPTQDELVKWFNTDGLNNIGIVTGKISNLIVIDLDDMSKNTPGLIPPSPVVCQTGKGLHYYYSYPPSLDNLRNSKWEYGDVRADGGMVLAPPSIHPTGKKYEWLKFEPSKLEPFPMEWLKEGEGRIRISENTNNHLKWMGEALKGLQTGNRNDTFTRIVGRLKYDGWKADDVFALLSGTATSFKFDLDELKTIINSVFNYQDNNTNKASLGNKSTKDLLKKKKSIDWCIKDILPMESLGIISGLPGQGKSWMLLDLALSYASKGKWMGQFDTRGGNILYCDEENSEDLISYRINKLQAANDGVYINDEIQWCLGLGWSFPDQESIDKLERLVLQYNPTLIVFDSLIRINRADENKASEMREVFKSLKNIVRKYKCSIIIADHNKKPTEFESRPENLLRGTNEKLAAVDSVLSLNRQGDSLKVVHAKCRFAIPYKNFYVSISDPTPDSTIVSYFDV